MLVGNYKASWNHKTNEGTITLVGISPPSTTPVTQVISLTSASEMSALLAILRIGEPIEHNGSTGLLSMKDPKVIPVT
jgi:hypothetical protein